MAPRRPPPTSSSSSDSEFDSDSLPSPQTVLGVSLPGPGETGRATRESTPVLASSPVNSPEKVRKISTLKTKEPKKSKENARKVAGDIASFVLPPSCKPTPFYAVYLLHSMSPSFRGHAYVGSTPDPARRLRQHNGEVKGGAKKTAWGKGKKRPWEFALLIHNFPNAYLALQFEWALQHPHLSRFLRPSTSPHYTPAFPHPAQAAQQNRIPAKMRAISDLLRSPYWRNRGLDVHFVADWAAQAWSDAGCPAPHSLVRITYGPPSEVAPSKREAERGIVGPQSSAAHTLPGEHAALDDLKSGSRPAFCSACRKPVDVRDPGSFLVCPARDCPEPASHLTCLAQKFLEKPFGYSDPNAVVPGAGHCPSCGTMARWADLVLAMRRRVGFAPASRKKVKASTGAAVNEESESEDEELDEDSDSDDEDSGSQRSLASSSETISYRAAIPDIRLPAISAASKHSRAESELVKGLDNLAVSDRLPPLPSATGTGARKAIGATRKHILSAQMAAYSVSNAADVDRGSLKAVERTEMEPADLRKERKKANTSEVHRKESSGAKGKAWNPGRDPTLEVSRETETETAESSLRREPDYSSMIGKVAIETRKPAVIPQKDPTFLDKEGSSSPHSDDFHSANENTDCDSDSDSDDDALKRLRGLLDKLRTEDK